MPLKDQLDALRAEDYARALPDVTLARQRAVDDLMASGLGERAVRAGSLAPAFRLRDGNGVVVSSHKWLFAGPMVLVFYRGRWCPYCNLDLRAIEAAADDIRSLGASILAVSQQTSYESRETVRLNALTFPSLVDRGGKLAYAFGLRWKASAELRAVEKACGVDLALLNGEPSWTLTMPARYIVAPDGMVEYTDISVDYTRRCDPADLLPVLRRLRMRWATDPVPALRA
ncbi:peroxiredoxin-like family protein [Dongia soli]|uniref:thioredoxin-dependent peroxiredoxin n=1 Tax=Dongia soli TaxID=600628 RepID=A0ABU5ELU5_9PROT|nr:peroxiredoxin-like family protein [Dongia soli]MDY0885906.1 peroxiredoxin-like family protein [Dongia soli]